MTRVCHMPQAYPVQQGESYESGVHIAGLGGPPAGLRGLRKEAA